MLLEINRKRLSCGGFWMADSHKENVKSKGSRNSSIELLRLFFIYLIVVYHAFLHGYSMDYGALLALGRDNTTLFHYCVVCLGKVGVPGFIFITGYYGVSLNVNKIFNLWLIALFYFLLFYFVLEETNYKRLFYGILFPFEKWWFLKDYLFLILLSPLINSGFYAINKKNQSLVVLSWAWVVFVIYYVFGQDSHNVLLFISIYLIALSLRQYKTFFYKYSLHLCLVSLTIYLCVAIILSRFYFDTNSFIRWISHNNLLILSIVAGIVIWAEKHSFSCKWINFFAKYVLAIYLLTDYETMRVYDSDLLAVILNWWGYGLCMLICLVCIFIDILRDNIFKISSSFLKFAIRRG